MQGYGNSSLLCIKLGFNEDFRLSNRSIKEDEFRVKSLIGMTLQYSNEVCQECDVKQFYLAWRRSINGVI